MRTYQSNNILKAVLIDSGGDYIVHGELEISRLDSNGKIVWQQSGTDIFVSDSSSNESFALKEDCIVAADWDGKKYKWDFDGNLI